MLKHNTSWCRIRWEQVGQEGNPLADVAPITSNITLLFLRDSSCTPVSTAETGPWAPHPSLCSHSGQPQALNRQPVLRPVGRLRPRSGLGEGGRSRERCV